MVLKSVCFSHKPRNIEDVIYGVIQEKSAKIQDDINCVIIKKEVVLTRIHSEI